MDLTPPALTPYSQRSLVEDTESEWRHRKISIMGVVRSFVSQLKPGQDLTRVSIPVALLYPFSMLEVVAVRETGYFEGLFPANYISDPKDRILTIAKWYLSTIQNENWYKKPYNPVLGETHATWASSPDYKKTYYLAEQVSHHPPVSAVVCNNPQEDVTIYSTASFAVKLQTNNVMVSIEGTGAITFGKLGEKYILSRRVPDTKITNVIIGTRRMFWNGEVTLSCPKTGLTCIFTFKEKSSENTVRASIFADANPNEELYAVEGKIGGLVNVSAGKSSDKRPLANYETIRANKINYPDPKDLDVWSSQVMWADANRYIVSDDIEKAEEAKKKVEAAQRARNEARKTTGEESKPRYFTKQEDGMWVLNDVGWKKLYFDYEKSAGGIGDLDMEMTFDPLANRKKAPSPPAIVAPTPVPQLATTMPSPSPTRRPSSADVRAIPISTSASFASSGSPSPPPGAITATPSSGTELAALDAAGKPLAAAALKPRASTKLITVDKSEAADDKNNIRAGWMKLRNAMKSWKTRWFVLRAGRLLYFKQEKHEAKQRCVGILELADCRVYARPTVKEGFCFKIDNVLSNPIYAKIGLKGEGIPYARMPVGSLTSALLLVGSEQERKAWMTTIQDQINYATATRNGGAPALVPSASARTLEGLPAPAVLPGVGGDEDDDEDESMGGGFESLMHKYDESQRQLFAGLAQQQVKIHKHLHKAITDMDERVQNIEKRLGNLNASVVKAQAESSVSIVSLIIYVLIATVIALLVSKVAGRWI